jgi:hypothetical protein
MSWRDGPVRLGALTLLAVAAAALHLIPEADDTVIVAAAARTSPRATTVAATPDAVTAPSSSRDADLELLARPGPAAFRSHAWTPVATEPAVIEVPAAEPVAESFPVLAPVAPPVPYAFMGRLEAAEGHMVWLDGGQGLLSARRGDVLGGTWRVESIDDDAIRFQYLPLDLPQLLPIGR